MKVGDLVRRNTGHNRVINEEYPGGPRVWKTYTLPKEEQRVGVVVRLGVRVKQMTVLTESGRVKFWFNNTCEVIK
jgi:hypothetical protein